MGTAFAMLLDSQVQWPLHRLKAREWTTPGPDWEAEEEIGAGGILKTRAASAPYRGGSRCSRRARCRCGRRASCPTAPLAETAAPSSSSPLPQARGPVRPGSPRLLLLLLPTRVRSSACSLALRCRVTSHGGGGREPAVTRRDATRVRRWSEDVVVVR